MNPLLKVVIWASAQADYDPGSFYWSATPTCVPPVAQFFTPSKAFAPTAQQFNAILQQRDQNIANLTAWTQCADGQNFGSPVTFASIATGMFPNLYWTAAYGQWLAGGIVSTTGWQAYQSGDGVNWVAFGNNPGVPRTPDIFITNPTTKAITAFLANSGTGSLITSIYNNGSLTWGAESAAIARYSNIGSPPKAFYFGETGAVLVMHQTQSTAATPNISYSLDSGATWTATASTLPANFGSNAGQLPFMTTQSPIAGSIPGLALLFSPVAGETHYLSSVDGKAWTTQTMPTLLTGEAVVGAGYDSLNAVFYLVVSTASASRVLTSTTGTSGWTVVGGLTIAHAAQSFAANGGELLMMQKVNGVWRMTISTDGAVTWGYARMGFAAAGGTVRAHGAGFIYSDGTSYALTHQAGAPPAVTI